MGRRAELVHSPFPFQRGVVTVVGKLLPLSSHLVARVGEPVPFLGAALAFGRDEVAPLLQPAQFISIDGLRHTRGSLSASEATGSKIPTGDEPIGGQAHALQLRLRPVDGSLRTPQRGQRLGLLNLLVDVPSRRRKRNQSD